MESSTPQQVMKMRLSNPASGSTSSSSSNFTRRKNWSQSILDSVRDVLHVLSADLRIVHCSSASSEFLGYKPSELVNHVFTEYIHVDDVDMFVREFKNVKLTNQTFRITYRFLRKDGKYTTLETGGRFFKDSFFGSARRVPTEAAHSIDSFLDLKMENEVLKKKLELMKAKDGVRKNSIASEDTYYSNTTASLTAGNDEDESSDEFDDYNIPSNATNVYTQGVNASYDIGESLSMFTGLRYNEGERSVGISLGLEGGELTDVDQLMGQSGGQYDFDRLTPKVRPSSEQQSKTMKKKQRVNPSEETKICSDCGTTEAPEWRRGPNGPKTLCNACGLRWFKNKKKQENDQINQ